MCGIAGIHQLRGAPVDGELVRRMLRPIAHRGPDGEGVVTRRSTALGHVRLSILDLSGGAQPMSGSGGSTWIVFNGEIFNYIELRNWLIRRGRRFTTRSDTEVILKLYEEEGEECVHHFNGQWAFAIWDSRRSTLFLSRDRLGIRPLYYTVVNNTLLFASEVKALFAHPDVPRQIDPIGLDQVFTFWSSVAPRTVFEGIRELPPAHCLTVRDGRIETRRYWQIRYSPQPTPIGEAAERLEHLLTDAIRLRLRSDVPVGAYLSGGLDSAVVTALAKRKTDAPLGTFSLTFPDPAFDESEYQRQVVAHLGTNHRSVHCHRGDIGRVFPEVIWHAETPVLRTAPAPLYLLSRLVRREGYKVVLTGEGADEMLGGYDIFKEAKVRRFWARRPESEPRAALLFKLYPYLAAVQAQSLAYQKAFFHVRQEDLADPLFSHMPRWQLTSRLKLFYSDGLVEELRGHDAVTDLRSTLPGDFSRWHPFCQAQYLEATMLLPGYILSSQGDRMAMANSVEGRYPFLDHRIAEFAAKLPPRWKMLGLDEKHLLKSAARGFLPETTIRRNKQPYRSPDAEAFFGTARSDGMDYVDELLSPERIRADSLFRSDAVAHLVAKARAGRIIGVKDHMALVGILSTQLLVDQFIRGTSPESTAAVIDGRFSAIESPASPSYSL